MTLCITGLLRVCCAQRVAASVGAGIAVLVASVMHWPAHAQAPRALGTVTQAAEQGQRWNELKPAQQAILKPLEGDWPNMASSSKRKWLELSSRFSKLTPAQQARVHERMADWTKLTPGQRGEARLSYQEAKQLPTQDRQARWEAYDALSVEQKQQFVAKAASAGEAARKGSASGKRSDDKDDRAAREIVGPQAKSNIVPNPAYAAPPRAVGPTVVQAGPGATTTLVTKRAAPPRHQQTGLPKIAGTPEFVNKTTLLPQRGPQGAAARAASVPATALVPGLQ